MKNLKLFPLLLTVTIIALSNTPILADNTYRYFYLYRNSDAYQNYQQEENSTSTEDQEEDNEFKLYEEERDYYVEGDEEYVDEESYEDETEETYSGDNDDYQD